MRRTQYSSRISSMAACCLKPRFIASVTGFMPIRMRGPLTASSGAAMGSSAPLMRFTKSWSSCAARA